MMKRKYADYRDWNKLKNKKIIIKYFNDKDFKGNASLLTDIKVNEKNKEIVIMNDNFKWLMLYPENNKNISVSIAINDKNEIIECYFDIAKYSGLTKEGIPYIDDLYLDVIVYPSNELKLIDEEELKEAFFNNTIGSEDFKLVYDIANDLIKKVQGKSKELSNFTYKYLNQMIKLSEKVGFI